MQKIKGRFKKDVSFKIIMTKVEYHKDFRALLSHWEDGQHGAEHHKLIKRAEAKQRSYEDWKNNITDEQNIAVCIII